LLLGYPLYDQNYAVSTLVAQLQEAADQHGEEVLERRLDAWVRLLSTFRAVFAGIQHERIKLPAYAGNLFNPDRFPFLEGRKTGTVWRDTPANPLPVNNRKVPCESCWSKPSRGMKPAGCERPAAMRMSCSSGYCRLRA